MQKMHRGTDRSNAAVRTSCQYQSHAGAARFSPAPTNGKRSSGRHVVVTSARQVLLDEDRQAALSGAMPKAAMPKLPTAPKGKAPPAKEPLARNPPAPSGAKATPVPVPEAAKTLGNQRASANVQAVLSSPENTSLANRAVGMNQGHIRNNTQRINELETQRSSLRLAFESAGEHSAGVQGDFHCFGEQQVWIAEFNFFQPFSAFVFRVYIKGYEVQYRTIYQPTFFSRNSTRQSLDLTPSRGQWSKPQNS